MSAFLYSLVMVTLFGSVALVLLLAASKLVARLSADDRGLLWLTPPVAMAVALVVLTVGFAIFSKPMLASSLAERLIGIQILGGELYVWKDGVWTLSGIGTGWHPWVFGVWLAVALAIAVLRGYQLFLARQFVLWSDEMPDSRAQLAIENLQNACPQAGNVALRGSHIVPSPVVVGLRRFAILMPHAAYLRFSDDELRAVLSHELQHVRSNDNLVEAILLLCEAMFWFNPLVWLAHREWSLAREVAADEAAIESSRIKPTSFAMFLLNLIGESKRPFLQTSLAAARDLATLKRRLIEMTLTNKRKSNSALLRWALGIGLATLTLPLFASKTLAGPAGDANILANPGFEDGLSNWTPANLGGSNTGVDFAIDSEIKHSGKNSLRMQKTENRFLPVFLLGQPVVGTGNINKRLKTTVWVKAEEAYKATIAVYFNSPSETKEIKFAAFVGVNDAKQPVSHDWKKYESIVDVPDGTVSLSVYAEMYGPGTVWMDDVSCEYVGNDSNVTQETPKDDDPEIEGIKAEEKHAGGDPNKKYLYFRGGFTQPDKGFKLFLILPGGDGSADFMPFIRRTFFYCAETHGILFAELVAPKWDKEQQVVWPTDSSKKPNYKFTTEEFIAQVIKDVKKEVKIDPSQVYLLGWSSGGPACYASLVKNPDVKGAFIAMSIFKKNELGSLAGVKDKKVYLFQSPDDKITKLDWAKAAYNALTGAKAKVKFVEYPGGHGWSSGDVYGDIAKGFQWLTE